MGKWGSKWQKLVGFFICLFHSLSPLDIVMQRLYWFVLFQWLMIIATSKEIMEGEDVQGSIAVNDSVSFELSTIVDWKYLVFTVNVTM